MIMIIIIIIIIHRLYSATFLKDQAALYNKGDINMMPFEPTGASGRSLSQFL